MRPFSILCLVAILIYAWVPTAEARGRAAGGCSNCAGGVCELPATPVVEQVQAQAKAWPWSKPDKPDKPTVAPVVDIVVPPPPALVVEPAVPAVATTTDTTAVDASQAEARKPLRRILGGVAAAIGEAIKGVGKAIANRPHKPVAKAVGRLFGRR